MKINSRFAPKCVTCNRPMQGQNNQPDYNWKCNWCSTSVCAGCYVQHTEDHHPNAGVTHGVPGGP